MGHLSLLAIAVFFACMHVISEWKKYWRMWRTRDLRKVWGIKNGEYVSIVCSELPDPGKRQHVEDREFIYNLKYGDVDAYFEIVVTLLRLYPEIKLKVLSSGESASAPIDLGCHLILIGGPDYNAITAKILEKNIAQYRYKNLGEQNESTHYPDEIVLYDSYNDKEYAESNDEKDYGYIERIRNPNNPENNIILIGGCHTIGVTGAAKAFSMAESEKGEIPKVVLRNARSVAHKVSKKSEFSVLISVERIGQTINAPVVDADKIMVRIN